MKMTPFIEGPVLDFSPEETNGQGNGRTGSKEESWLKILCPPTRFAKELPQNKAILRKLLQKSILLEQPFVKNRVITIKL
jgi:hypothetical protein